MIIKMLALNNEQGTFLSALGSRLSLGTSGTKCCQLAFGEDSVTGDGILTAATAIYLVRHGSHDLLGQVLCGRMGGVALSECGLEEAAAVGRRLALEKVAVLYSSPLMRARQTAEAIGRALGLRPRVAEALNEVDMGRWTGAHFENLRHDPDWKVWNAARDTARAPGGECMADVEGRIGAWIGQMRRLHPERGIAAVSHGDVIKAAIARTLQLGFNHLDRFEIAPASISVIEVYPWGERVRSVNETAA